MRLEVVVTPPVRAPHPGAGEAEGAEGAEGVRARGRVPVSCVAWNHHASSTSGGGSASGAGAGGAGAAGGELYACCDDESVYKVNSGAAVGRARASSNASSPHPASSVCALDSHALCMHWYPTAGNSRGQKGGGSEVFAVGCSDGSVKILGRHGRIEANARGAHTGAVTRVRWNHEGTALMSVGEDANVRIWSSDLTERSRLAVGGIGAGQREGAAGGGGAAAGGGGAAAGVYCCSWSGDGDAVLLTHGRCLVIKSIGSASAAGGGGPQGGHAGQSGGGNRAQRWRAHEGVVLGCDWNPVNNTIVSRGEDCRYKVWDCFGRLLFQSSAMDHAVTSVAWSPDGSVFAVGLYNAVRLCDRAGWTYDRVKCESGSLYDLAWTMDGTQLCGAGASGSLVLATVLEKRAAWSGFEARLETANRILVSDLMREGGEELDFRDRVVSFSMRFGFFVVATSTQCFIYNTNNWNTPHIFDLKAPVSVIVQAATNFATVDPVVGIQVYTYEGRQVCNPRFQGLRTEFINANAISLSPDVLAVVDSGDTRRVRFFSTTNGAEIGGGGVAHTAEVVHVGLNQVGSGAGAGGGFDSQGRRLAFTDRNRDMYIATVPPSGGAGGAGAPRMMAAAHDASAAGGVKTVKLSTMVDCLVWHSEVDVLCAVADQKLTSWYCPTAVYVDPDLLPLTKAVINEDSNYGFAPRIVECDGPRVTVRRSDGALRTSTAVSSYHLMLHRLAAARQWSKALRLCRHAKEKTLWACLAVTSVACRELNTAVACFAAIEEVDKVQYLNYIRAIPSEEARHAELLLFMRRPHEAESILMQAGLTYRAIMMNMNLVNWDRAIEIALAQRTHIDTVLYHRREFLRLGGRSEGHAKFLSLMSEVEVDEEAVRRKAMQEEEDERNRPGARRLV